MLTWESVEISINKIDVDDVITTSLGTTDSPFAPAPIVPDGNDNDAMNGVG